MLKSRIQTFCFSCWLCLFPVSLSANEALFHLDYEGIERVARGYLQERHPDESPDEIRLKAIRVDYINHKQFHDVATVLFYGDSSRSEAQSLGGNHTIIESKQVMFTLKINPQGEVIHFSEGTSVKMQRLKHTD